MDGLQRNSDTSVFHRAPKTRLRTAVKGDGPYILDDSGNRYIDASGGAAVSCLGHSHPAPIRAIQEQAATLAFAHTGFFTSSVLEDLASFLTYEAPGNLTKAYLTSGGSESVETALKLARQYCVEIGEPQRSRIIARRQSYHGNTLGALSAGGNLWRRAAYEPLLIDVSHVSPCYPYRDRYPGESAEAFGLRIADELEATILSLGPETVLCFIAETVAGATLGCVPPVPGYFERLRQICDKYGVLLILDEVMCGMGRTGTLFAYEQEGITPDLVTIAKGLGAGYQPVGAVLCRERIYDAIVGGTGFFQHGHTYTGHVTACAAALAVQQAIRDEKLLDNVNRAGALLANRLNETFGDHPNVGDIRGRGLFWAMEFVKDRASKAPLDPDARTAARIKATALDHGLICYPMGGVIDGRSGDHVMLAPPFIVDDGHIEEIIAKLKATVDTVLPTS